MPISPSICIKPQLREFVARACSSEMILRGKVVFATSTSSSSPPKLDNSPAIAFRWPAGRQFFKLLHRFALSRHLQAKFPAGLGLAIESLRNRSRAPHLAEQKNFHMKLTALVGHMQHVSNPDLAGGLGGLSVRLNPAQLTGSRR